MRECLLRSTTTSGVCKVDSHLVGAEVGVEFLFLLRHHVGSFLQEPRESLLKEMIEIDADHAVQNQAYVVLCVHVCVYMCVSYISSQLLTSSLLSRNT